MKFHDFSPFYRSGEGIRSKVSGDRLIDNPAVADAQGGSGASFSFDGTDDEIIVGTDAAIELGTSDFTTSAWIKTSSQTQQFIIQTWSGAGVGHSFRVTTAGLLYYRMRDGAGTPNDVSIYSSTTVDDGEWHHAVFVADRSGNGQIYIDGVADGAAIDVSSVESISGGVDYYLGYSESNLYPFDGQISQVRFHNRALSAAEVRAAYNGQAVPFEYRGASQDELVTNGDMDTAGSWNVAGTATVDAGSSGVAQFTGNTTTGNYIYQAVSGAVGKRWRLKYDVTANSLVGSGNLRLPGGGNGIVNSPLNLTQTAVANGHIQECDGASTGNCSEIVIGLDAGFTSGSISLDNVSLTQIGCVAEYLPSGINGNQWVDTSGNNLHGSTDTATAVNHTTGTLTLESGANLKMQDGGGIDFTNYTGDTLQAGAAATGNLLDDYEEGTWTPTLFHGATQMTGFWVAGKYVKIGKLVYLSCYLQKDTVFSSGTTGDWFIKGLPYNLAYGSSSGYPNATAGYLTINNVNYGNELPHRWQADVTNALELYGTNGNTVWTSGWWYTSFTGVFEVA